MSALSTGSAAGFCAMVLCLWSACGTQPPPAPAPPARPLSEQAESLRREGDRSMMRGDLPRAGEAYDAARRLAESLDDTKGLIGALNDIGHVALRRGETAQAVTSHERAVLLAQQLREPRLLLDSLTALATAEHQAGRLPEAGRRYSEALELAQQMADRPAEATLRNNLGLVRQAEGDVEQAGDLFRHAMALNQAMGRLESEASTHVNLGMLAEARHDYEAAEREYERALELDKAAEQRMDIAADLLRLCRITDRRGLPDRALAYAERAYRSYLAQSAFAEARWALSQAVEFAKKTDRAGELARLEAELISLTAAHPAQ